MKNEIRERLEILAEIERNETDRWEVVESDWAKYGKDRTYFKIVRTRTFSKHYSEYDFGYFDNIEKKYYPSKNDAFHHNYELFGGASFDLDGEYTKRHSK